MDKDPSVFDELHTLRDFIRWGASRMQEADVVFGHGCDNSLDEAAALVLHAVHLAPMIPEPLFDARMTLVEKERVLDLLVERIRSRRPAAYLMQEAWFAGMSFYVDKRVLVPRSPIAELIETRFQPWMDPAAVRRVLDIGTGSGCIAIACARAFPRADVDAVDTSKDALDVVQINIDRYQLAGRVHPMPSDVYATLADQRYDIIVSNPPYVSSADMTGLPQEYGHEPEGGLAAGTDGLDIVRRILAGATDHLSKGGILVVEVGGSQVYVEETWPEVPFLWLDFERGGEGVFLLTVDQVHEFSGIFKEREQQ